MKTLDEVIKNLEDGTEHLSAMLISRETWSDALHYLKVLQKMQKAQPLEKSEWNELYNQPLTWDELNGMEGKPVWVEEKDMPSTWIIIWDVTENWLYPTGCDAYRHEEYGKTWKAYRKERE